MYRHGINRILTNLPARVRSVLVKAGENRELRAGETLLAAGQTISHVIFPFKGIASVLYGRGEDAAAVEIIGNEGIVGRPVLLGVPAASTNINVLFGGEALFVPANVIVEAFNSDLECRDVLLRYIRFCSLQNACTSFARGEASVNGLVARWLLMMHDRIESDTILLTQKKFGTMLGTRRAGVNKEIKRLKAAGTIAHQSGRIHILDRAALIEIAGQHYGKSEENYQTWFPTRKHHPKNKAR